MRHLWILPLALLACSTTNDDTNDTPDTVVEGVPCDVGALLATRCLACHGTTPAGGASLTISAWGDLVAASPSDHGLTVAERALARMKDEDRPMPPGERLSDEEIAVLEQWIVNGSQEMNCDPGIVDAGEEFPDAGEISDAGTTDGGLPLPDGPPVCTSNTYWTRGDNGSATMNPGESCIACHLTKSRAPRFSVAGTVFPTLHEPNDCNGQRNATVEITDATGKVVRLTTNTAGNFSTTQRLTFPVRARVTANGIVREMIEAKSSGDCNSCHTQAGREDAPGRIVGH